MFQERKITGVTGGGGEAATGVTGGGGAATAAATGATEKGGGEVDSYVYPRGLGGYVGGN